MDHRHLEGPAVGVELAGRGDGVGHPHEGGRTAQGAGAHEAARRGAVLRHGVVAGVVGAGVVGELELEQPGLVPRLAQVAVVGVEQAELAHVGHELGEEAPLEPGVGVDLERARGLEDARVDGLGRHAHALPDLGRGRPQPVAQGVLDQELLAVLELGLGQPLVVLGQAEHAERHVAGLVGHDVAQQLLEQRLLGVAQHRAEGGERQALDDDLHAEVGDVPPARPRGGP